MTNSHGRPVREIKTIERREWREEERRRKAKARSDLFWGIVIFGGGIAGFYGIVYGLVALYEAGVFVPWGA